MNPINNIMKLATDLAYCTDDEFGEIKVALRAAIEQALTPGEPVAWTHDCAALLTNDGESWIDACPHCGKPRPAPQPKPAEQEPMGVPQGWKLVPEVPTNEWINNLARRRTGSFEDVPFAEIHQSIAELLESAPEAPQPAKREPLTDEEIDNTTRKQVDDLLDHIYEYGTAAEGIDYRVRAIARAIEAAVWGDGK